MSANTSSQLKWTKIGIPKSLAIRRLPGPPAPLMCRWWHEEGRHGPGAPGGAEGRGVAGRAVRALAAAAEAVAREDVVLLGELVAGLDGQLLPVVDRAVAVRRHGLDDVGEVVVVVDDLEPVRPGLVAGEVEDLVRLARDLHDRAVH